MNIVSLLNVSTEVSMMNIIISVIYQIDKSSTKSSNKFTPFCNSDMLKARLFHLHGTVMYHAWIVGSFSEVKKHVNPHDLFWI